MSHLEDKLAEFVYEELTAAEMEEVRVRPTGIRMTIAFGALPEAEPLQAATQPVVVEPQPVDYEQIVARVTSEQQAWLESELESRIQRISAADGREVQRLRTEMAYLSDLQRAALRDTLENASSIQLLAARTEVRE